jgi:hypothetical protein
MKEITKKKIELLVGLIFLFSVTGGLVWANIFSILDFFQELPSRRILPLLMIYLFLIYLRIEFREKKGKRLTLLILSGMVQGISILNDYLFGFGVFLSIITTIFILDIPIKERLKTLLIIISTTFITMISFIVIYYPQNEYPRIRTIFAYVFSYGASQFGHEFKIIGPDIFFLTLAIFGLFLSVKRNKNRINIASGSLDPTIFLISLLICYNAIYWAGRSFEIQIVASSGIYSALLITALYSKSRQSKNLESLSNIILNFVLISPILFNLINYKSITNDYLRLFTKEQYEFVNATSNTTEEEIVAIENQIEFVFNKIIMTKKSVALVSDFGNLFAAKYKVYNANILNHPTSITNPYIMEIICRNSLERKMEYLLLDTHTEIYFNNVKLCVSNYSQIQDINYEFPRFNLYKSN